MISQYNQNVNPCTPQAEADSCTPCPVGHFAGVTGLTRCEACPVGEFANVTGSDDCTLCPAGKNNAEDTNNISSCGIEHTSNIFSPFSEITSSFILLAFLQEPTLTVLDLARVPNVQPVSTPTRDLTPVQSVPLDPSLTVRETQLAQNVLQVGRNLGCYDFHCLIGGDFSPQKVKKRLKNPVKHSDNIKPYEIFSPRFLL